VAAKLELIVSAKDLASGVLGDVNKNAGGLGRTLSGPLKAGGIAAAGALAGLGAFLISSVKEAAEAEREMKQLETVLKSTGGAAGITKKGALDLADALAKQSTFTDDAVLSAENLLLTFTNIKGPAFEGATQAVLDMSVALGQDLKTSSIQVGKALNDPIEGVSALQRVGVSFTEQQKEQIRTMVEMGDTAGAQALILKELNTEFGGQAQADAETFAGKMQRLKNSFDELKETLGAALLPELTKLSDWMIAHEDEIKQTLHDAIEAGKQALKDLKAAGEELRPVLEGLLETFRALPEPVQKFTLAVGALTAALIALNAAGIPVITMLKFLGEGLLAVAGLFTFMLVVLAPVLAPLALVAGALYLLGVRTSDVKNIINDFLIFVVGNSERLRRELVGPFDDARDAVNWLIRRVERLIDVLNSIPRVNLPDLSPGFNAPSLNPRDLFRAAGGPVSARLPYIVGEKGPEWFVPKAAGTIIPDVVVNNRPPAVVAGETRTVNLTIRGPLIEMHGKMNFDNMTPWDRTQLERICVSAVRKAIQYG
jgi:hypothetical protein